MISVNGWYKIDRLWHIGYFYYVMEGSEIMEGKNAKRSDEITEEMWNEVLEFNRNMV